ncbi:hypothetical protein Peur_025653 [Populus x canadensis]
MTLENPSLGSDSLEMDNDSLSSAKAAFDDFLGEVRDSINTSVNNGGNVVQSSLDTITSSITSIKEGASEAVDGVLSKVFSTFDQTGELASDRLTSFSSGLREATQTATGTSIDVLRVAITAVEESIAKGASFVVYSYGPAKDLLPPKIRGALNLSEERVTQILRPIGATFQQVYIAIEGLEKRLGLDPNDPVVPFVLFLGTSATLWLMASREAFKGWTDLDDILTAAVIRNLKAVHDRYQVMVMDADGSRSKGIARYLRTLGVKAKTILGPTWLPVLGKTRYPSQGAET